MTTTPKTKRTPEELLDARRKTIRASVDRHNERMAAMTRLEQAAWMERKALGEDAQPYTPRELEEAEAIRAQTEALQARAKALNQTVAHRLEREAGRDEGKAALLTRFKTMRTVRVELTPF